jgi:Flp pilus assembly protein TadD
MVMVKSLRLGAALSAVGMIGALTACATPGARHASRASIFNDKIDQSNIGLATRAQEAIEKGDFASGIALAERAVGNTPNDAGFRALLGNAYFAGGRFASAESAYRDSLSLMPGQPQLVLKLALVTIAQGKSDSAMLVLEGSRQLLDPADYGLALALAGQPQAAVGVLDQAARVEGADARVRQNLALAHALSGDWTMARTVASQDVAPDQLDGRIQQWMSFAKPARASDQVASLTGFAPAPSDPGQPVRLALVRDKDEVRLAEAAVEAAPVETAPPLVVQQAAVEAPAVDLVPEPMVAAAVPEPMVAAAAPAAPVAVVEQARVLAQAVAEPMVKAAQPKTIKAASARPGLSPRAASLRAESLAPRRSAFTGKSQAVVQLGAYASRAGVAAGWAKLAAKHPALRGYTPATARFEGPNGTVYRLSVSGFGSGDAAKSMCSSLKTKGGACFVRSVAGDAPIRLASL